MGTEITTAQGRFPWDSTKWTLLPDGGDDENGNPIPEAWTNDVNVVFPKPSSLDLALVSHVRLYAWFSQDHLASSPALGLSTSVHGKSVTVAPGGLVLTML